MMDWLTRLEKPHPLAGLVSRRLHWLCCIAAGCALTLWPAAARAAQSPGEQSFSALIILLIGIGVVALSLLGWLLYRAGRKQTDLVGSLAQETAGKEHLAAELELFRLAVEQSPASIVITNTDGTIEYVNPRFCETSGYTAEEVLGGNPRILKSGGLSKEYYETMWQTLAKGHTWRGEFVNKRKSGEEYWESASISPACDSAGNTSHYVAVKEDITLRKQMQDELLRKTTLLQATLDNMQHGILMVDAGGKVLASNRQLQEMLQFRPGLLASGPDFSVLVEEWASMYGQDERIKKKVIESAQKSESSSFELELKAGLFIEVRHNPLEGGGFIRTFTDITSRKQAESLREDMDRIARHDLKTPLTGIIGVPQLLQSDDNLTDLQRDLLKDVRESGLRMLRMVNLSLDLYKIESGLYEVCPQPVNLGALLQDILRESRSLLESTEVSVEISHDGGPYDETTPCLAWGEELLCYSMLANIVRNAIEASAQGGVVRIAYSGGNGDNVVSIAVHNEGVVPEGIRDNFFDKYVTSGKLHGTGLGTYSARIMAEVQGGKIAMRSSQTEGTTITITLPGVPENMGAL